MITLHKLKLFIVVYERGSLNQAAHELYMAQSAVSQHMQSLEAALGTALFERSPRGVIPTRAGKTLYGYAQRILQLLSEAEREIIHMGETPPLNVAATPGVSVYLLPAWLQRFQQTHTAVSISLQTVLTAAVVRDVLNHRYDLGFLEGELDELDQPDLGRMRAAELEYFVLVQPRHPFAQQGTISVQALSAAPLINRQPASRARRWLEGRLNAYGVQVRSAAELDSIGGIKYALLTEGQTGFAILPRYAVEREVERGELALVHLQETDLRRPLLLVWDKRRAFNPVQRAFIALLAEGAPQLRILL